MWRLMLRACALIISSSPVRKELQPIPVAAWSIRRGCAAALLLAGNVGSNLAAGMDVCCECCVLSLRRADHSSRGVLPSVVCPVSVIAKLRKSRGHDPESGLSATGGGMGEKTAIIMLKIPPYKI
jgi:hypothetical protein